MGEVDLFSNRSLWVSVIFFDSKLNAQGNVAFFEGVPELYGRPVSASDLRAGAALIIAGIAANGITEVSNIEYIDRGYEKIEDKFRALGADIKRVTE